MNGTAIAFTMPPVRRAQCKVCDILASLMPDDAARAREALAAKMSVWPHMAIAENFALLGHTVSDHSVRVHRKRCA